MIWLKTLLFTIIAPGAVTVLLPYWILSSKWNEAIALPGALRFFGLAPLLIGFGIYLWCAYDFAAKGRGTPAPIDPPKQLVRSGLYRFTRNPMYVGVVLILLGEAVFFSSAALFFYAAVVFIGFNGFILFYEEPTLRRLFGESYSRYCAEVPRWIFKRKQKKEGNENPQAAPRAKN
jgi:protein-S-isoprenylcysteine O-methyltransferase Ste14